MEHQGHAVVTLGFAAAAVVLLSTEVGVWRTWQN